MVFIERVCTTINLSTKTRWPISQPTAAFIDRFYSTNLSIKTRWPIGQPAAAFIDRFHSTTIPVYKDHAGGSSLYRQVLLV
jgi:hypothetical protein